MTFPFSFPDLLALYRRELLDSVVPFWLTHAQDHEHGGLLTCLADDGSVLSTDKYLWSQLRAIWTFAALYNQIEARPEWLAEAERLFEFVRRVGRDEEGRWIFAVDQQGTPLQGATSIYADGFAIYGLTELARANGNAEALALAVETYHNVRARLARPGSYRTDPYPLPEGVKAHGISMIFSLVFNELGHLLGDRSIIEASLHHAREVMEVYRRPDEQRLYEFATLDNQLMDTPRGRTIVPGHAIESMWFMIHIFQREGDEARVRQAIETMRWNLELGWDWEHGGLFHAVDATGGESWWPFPEAKLWWPHTEALYALLLAYELSGEAWTLEWYTRVHEYAFSHYPVPAHGEWTQRLDRYGQPFTQTVALPVKDPFHLPRALLLSIGVLERLTEQAGPPPR